MKINWTYIKGFLLFGLVAFLVGFSHYKNRSQKVTETLVKFQGDNNLFMTFPMVDSLLKQNGSPIKNQLKSTLNLFELEDKIQAHPMVKKADVSATIDGVLKVDIEQRKPIARVISKGYYIDESAEKMPLSSNYSSRVLAISGDVNKDDFKTIHRLVTKILSDEFFKKQIIGIRKLPDNEEYQLYPRIGNHTITLGKIDNLHQKLMNLKVFYVRAMKDSIIHKYSNINLQYNHQVVCTKK